MEEVTLKTCRKCGNSYEASAKYFYRYKNTKDGLNSWCKHCIDEYGKKRRSISKNNLKDDLKIIKNNRAFKSKRPNYSKRKSPICPVRKPSNPPNKIDEKSNVAVKSHALNFYRTCFLNVYENLVSLGIDEHIVKRMFNVSQVGYDNHTKNDKAGEIAYQEAMSKLQGVLSNAILVKAFGYNYEEEEITYVSVVDEETGELSWKEFRKKVHKKHHPGWAELIEYFMNNRFPDQWKKSTEVVRKTEGYDSDPGQRNRKQIESLARGILEEDSTRPKAEHSVQG
jgi:hypothetical protein